MSRAPRKATARERGRRPDSRGAPWGAVTPQHGFQERAPVPTVCPPSFPGAPFSHPHSCPLAPAGGLPQLSRGARTGHREPLPGGVPEAGRPRRGRSGRLPRLTLLGGAGPAFPWGASSPDAQQDGASPSLPSAWGGWLSPGQTLTLEAHLLCHRPPLPHHHGKISKSKTTEWAL